MCVWVCVHNMHYETVCVCMHVCVCARLKEREREVLANQQGSPQRCRCLSSDMLSHELHCITQALKRQLTR